LPQVVTRASPPPPGETRFRRGEVLVEASLATPPAALAAVARRHRLTETDVAAIALLGVSVHLWRIPDSRDAAAVVRELGGEAAAARVQPNYLYALQQTAAPVDPASPPLQYALDKLHVDAALLATASGPVRVAVIDTAIDEVHPDLAGAVEARFDAIGDATPPHMLDHGTAVAGAIAARGRLKGVDPNVRILSARAFDGAGAGESGSTMSLLKAIDWAAREQAKVVNMSFAGPPDPTLRDIVAAAVGKGLTLVAAAGNAGPQSPPLYPAADEGVIAVTATDADDRRYEKANVGRYIAVAAPGVDVLLPAPQGSYALETGTSVSAALVTGVAALLVALRPQAAPAEVRNLLVATATPLGRGREYEFGAGLVDARRAADAAIR
jgi:subtilisin family serine protease